MRKFSALIFTVARTLCIAGCTSPNEKSEIVSENEATTLFVETIKLENSSVNIGNKPTEKSILSIETISFATSENVAEKLSKI